MSAELTYLDSSALVKLAVKEPETRSLVQYLRRRRLWVTSALARTEVIRALLFDGSEAIENGRAVLARCEVLRVSSRVLDAAGLLEPLTMRSLDAIHVATALQLGGDLRSLVTYDSRMGEAARSLGVRVDVPGA
jgi:uncharacterized protein